MSKSQGRVAKLRGAKWAAAVRPGRDSRKLPVSPSQATHSAWCKPSACPAGWVKQLAGLPLHTAFYWLDRYAATNACHYWSMQ